MTSFSLDPAAVERMRARAGAPAPDARAAAPGEGAARPEGSRQTGLDDGVEDRVEDRVDGWFEGDDWPSRARSFGRRLVAPAERRFRVEVERAVERHDTDLARQVEELRAELIRTRTAHAAEIAALNEQLRGRS